MSVPIRVGILGVGMIAREQHIPSIAANPDFLLVATASHHAGISGIDNYASLEDMLASGASLDAIAICTPLQTHYDAARRCLQAGKHVLLEKPPCTSIAQFSHLKRLAEQAGVTLYQAWHSQHAHGVTRAAAGLKNARLHSVRAVWREDVRRWHPGQTWIWEAGGFGVLDPGINAISILTKLISEPIFPVRARFYVPSNCQTPIAVDARLATPSGVTISLDFDFRHTGEQTWDIEISTDEGSMLLSAGGAVFSVEGDSLSGSVTGLHQEYESIYRRFSELIHSSRSETDGRPSNSRQTSFLPGIEKLSIRTLSRP